MIVRISTEGQYEILENDVETLNELDAQAVAASEADEEDQFRAIFSEMIQFVRTNGERLAEDRLVPSQVILPPPDSSLQDMRTEFTGDGLIPD